MSNEAGPAPKPVDATTLAEATAKFERGIQCIRANNIEAAVQLFSEVLQVRAQHYGELAPECASSYYRYGAALLYQAQDSGDVFGASAKEAEGEEGEEEEEREKAEDKKSGGNKDKALAAASESKEEEDGEDSGEAADNDLQLAWENLETAKVIWAREGEGKNAQQLADVHGLLGDVAMESDDFGTALAELDAALAHLLTFVQPDDRRIAEVQYKRCCALQFGGEVEAALPAVQAACDCLAQRREVLGAKLAACRGEGEESEKLRAEGEDVAALLEDLKEKMAELQELIARSADTKNMIKSTFAQLAAVGGGSVQAAGGGTATGGGDGVQNLGVVGRGTKRINLQPVQTNVSLAAPAAGTDVGACAASLEAPAKRKRSLEDLMGGDGGETTIGFDSMPMAAPAPALAAAAPAAAEPAATQLPQPSVPAFLQAASVQAVYGEAGEQQ